MQICRCEIILKSNRRDKKKTFKKMIKVRTIHLYIILHIWGFINAILFNIINHDMRYQLLYKEILKGKTARLDVINSLTLSKLRKPN